MIPRSYLYVPGSAGSRLERASSRGADALILDLEDGVTAAAKQGARHTVAAYLAASPPGPPAWVRINQGEAGTRDVAAVVGAALAGICVPKVSGPLELHALDGVLAAAEARAGLPYRSVPLCPLIESAAGLLAAAAIAACPRVTLLQLGEADLTADLGLEPGAGGAELLYARSAVVAASRAAGLIPPVAPVSAEFRDLDGFRAQTAALRRLGFRGRCCIHPAQVAIAHEVFTPSAAEVAEARAVLAAFDASVARGDGAGVDHRGRMVDEAVVRSARQVIALSR